MVFDESLLIDKKILIKEIKVGTFRNVFKTGSVMLNDKVIIHGVLLVEGFRHNLLSVSKFAEKNDILVHFTKDACHFQDQCSHKIIGTGKKQGGLYYYYSYATHMNKELFTTSACTVHIPEDSGMLSIKLL